MGVAERAVVRPSALAHHDNCSHVAQALKVVAHALFLSAEPFPDATCHGEMYHPRGLSFATQRKVVILREVRDLTWPDIASQVKNLQGKVPKPRLCREYYRRFNAALGPVVSRYHKCGRKPWKITTEIERYLIARLKALRNRCICTSTMLQQEVAKHKGVTISDSAVRKVLAKHGFKWLRRGQKRKFAAGFQLTWVVFFRVSLNSFDDEILPNDF